MIKTVKEQTRYIITALNNYAVDCNNSEFQKYLHAYIEIDDYIIKSIIEFRKNWENGKNRCEKQYFGSRRLTLIDGNFMCSDIHDDDIDFTFIKYDSMTYLTSEPSLKNVKTYGISGGVTCYYDFFTIDTERIPDGLYYPTIIYRSPRYSYSKIQDLIDKSKLKRIEGSIETLKQDFKKIKIDFGKEILENISTKKDDGGLFPPYIPFVGKNYKKFKVLVYSTAQNIKYDDFRILYQKNFDKLVERLYYYDGFTKKYTNNQTSYQDIAINPYRTGVIPALLGVFIYAKFGKRINELNEINNWIGISNYYKFSLNNKKEDINPETEIKKFINNKEQIEKYWGVNDELVEKELDVLKPNFIISFKGRKLEKLEEYSYKEYEVIKINDPSWILQGGGGVFKEGGSWWKKAEKCKEDNDINELIDKYINQISERYKGKKESVRIYLLKYYSDWQFVLR